MNKQLLEECNAKLLAEQKKLKTMLGHDTVVDSEFPGGRKPEFSQNGTEQGENASEVEQFGNDLAVAEDLEKRLKQVEAALVRITDGTYGKCQMGDVIEDARLQAEPAAEFCLKHAK